MAGERLKKARRKMGNSNYLLLQRSWWYILKYLS
jgi:hypothetical protein